MLAPLAQGWTARYSNQVNAVIAFFSRMPVGKGSELTHVFRALAPDQQVCESEWPFGTLAPFACELGTTFQ